MAESHSKYNKDNHNHNSNHNKGIIMMTPLIKKMVLTTDMQHSKSSNELLI